MTNGMCALVTGILFFKPSVADLLLSLLVMPPFDACTYFGIDNGAEPFQLQLFLDLVKSVVMKPASVECETNVDRARYQVLLALMLPPYPIFIHPPPFLCVPLPVLCNPIQV